jgi:hypothetical protein
VYASNVHSFDSEHKISDVSVNIPEVPNEGPWLFWGLCALQHAESCLLFGSSSRTARPGVVIMNETVRGASLSVLRVVQLAPGPGVRSMGLTVRVGADKKTSVLLAAGSAVFEMKIPENRSAEGYGWENEPFAKACAGSSTFVDVTAFGNESVAVVDAGQHVVVLYPATGGVPTETWGKIGRAELKDGPSCEGLLLDTPLSVAVAPGGQTAFITCHSAKSGGRVVRVSRTAFGGACLRATRCVLEGACFVPRNVSKVERRMRSELSLERCLEILEPGLRWWFELGSKRFTALGHRVK